MDPALIIAHAAVAVSIVGGITAFATTFFTQRYQALQMALGHEAHVSRA